MPKRLLMKVNTFNFCVLKWERNTNIKKNIANLSEWVRRCADEMSGVVTLYVSNNKKMNINETQSKLHSKGPKLKSNLVTDFDENQTVRFPKKYDKHVMPTKS